MGIEFQDRKAMPSGVVRIEGVETGLGWNGDGTRKESLHVEWKVEKPFIDGKPDAALLQLRFEEENTIMTGAVMRRSEVEDLFTGGKRGRDALQAILADAPFMKQVMDGRKWSSFEIADARGSDEKFRIAGSGADFKPAARAGRAAAWAA